VTGKAGVMQLTFAQVRAAAERIGGRVRRTPVRRVEFDGRALYLKLENRQRTGSFKIRGAINSALGDREVRRAGLLVTASAGNHGLGVAAAARLSGLGAVVFVQEGASALKRRKIKRLGGDVRVEGKDYDDAEQHARRFAQARELPFISPLDDPYVLAGQGTAALELLGQIPAPDVLVVPVGGGGLLAGTALAARTVIPNARVIGVQTDQSPAMVRSLAAGRPVQTPIGKTICDGLAGRWVAAGTLNIVQRLADDVVIVNEEAVPAAMRFIWDRTGQAVEPSAAVGVAALMEGVVDPGAGAAAIITGGNIERELFANILSR